MYKKEMSYCSQTFHGTCNNVSIANTTTIYNYTTNTSDGSRRNIDQSQAHPHQGTSELGNPAHSTNDDSHVRGNLAEAPAQREPTESEDSPNIVSSNLLTSSSTSADGSQSKGKPELVEKNPEVVDVSKS